MASSREGRRRNALVFPHLMTTDLLPASPSSAVHLLQWSSSWPLLGCTTILSDFPEFLWSLQSNDPPWRPCSDPQRVGSWLIPSAKVNKLSDITIGLTSRNNVFVLLFKVTGKTRPFLSHRHFKPSTHSTYNSLPWWACSLNKNVYNPRCPNMPLVFTVCLKKQS